MEPKPGRLCYNHSQRRGKVFCLMLKIVVFDGGFGGDLFAEWLKEEIPIVEIIRVIDWRNAEIILSNPKEARKVAKAALAPYIGKVDLIVFANHLLTITSLKHFRNKYKNQKFIGFELAQPGHRAKRNVLVLTTKSVAKTINYHNFLFRLKTKVKTLCLDSWPSLIDDGELTQAEVVRTLEKFLLKEKFYPEELIIACSQFHDIKSILFQFFNRNIKIYDSYDRVMRQICQILKIRGGAKKRK